MGTQPDLNDTNRQVLDAALQAVRSELDWFAAKKSKPIKEGGLFSRMFGGSDPTTERPAFSANNNREKAKQYLENLKTRVPTPSALDTLSDIFGLSPFEQKLILLCAGMDLDMPFARSVANAQGGAGQASPTFSLALAALEGAHWSALSPNAPLRYWKIIELTDPHQLTRSGLKLDERILHYLIRIPYMDVRLNDLVSPVFAESPLSPSQAASIQAVQTLLTSKNNGAPWSVIQLAGSETADKLLAGADLAASLGLLLYKLPAGSLPVVAKEVHELSLLWSRESALNACALYVEGASLDLNDKTRLQSITTFLENVRGIVMLDSGSWTPNLNRPVLEMTVNKPLPEEQLTRWNNHLGDKSPVLSKALNKVVSQFNLGARSIDDIAMEVTSRPEEDETKIAQRIWDKCRHLTRPKIDELAQRIEPRADWDALVLPEMQKKLLRETAEQVRHRIRVYRDWGFGATSERGLGISALFTGESGTGKTMASEVIANELQLDLYRIDLSQVVNKYIGETEKNLKRIFDAAEEGGAILLFDEADALFGKRSDVKDSHDRYSNIEVSYLLQRMESYRGLAILTTNMKNALDKAFLRRIRFVIQFPYPDAEMRAEIWKKAFPRETPVEGLDFDKLARLNVAGGNIRNIALNAAFLAAREDSSVQMHHIGRAVRNEFAKLEKTLSANDINGW